MAIFLFNSPNIFRTISKIT